MSERDPQLDGFLEATRGELDRSLESSAPQPDFAAMFERARELDPRVVDEQSVARARELAPVVTFRSARLRDEAGDLEALEPFTTALRDRLDTAIGERRASVIPPPHFIERRSLPRPRRWAWAAAAGLALFGSIATASLGGDADLAGLASDLHDQVRSGAAALTRTARQSAPAISVQPRSTGESLAPLVEPELMPEPSAEALTPPNQPRARKRQHARDELAELDARAQALWRAGDLDGAKSLFREIVRRGGKGRWAELAYGELFSLAQTSPGSEREALWNAYLASFPKGRYAEDARAGLCRRAPEAQEQACWSDYLAQHPKGTHRAEAQRKLGPEVP